MLAFLLSLTDEDSQKKIETIYYKYHYDMLRFARYSLRKKGASNIESGAEDVVQNAFLKITKYIHSIDLGESEKSLKTYLFSIVSNEVYNYMSDEVKHAWDDEAIEDIPDNVFFADLQIKERYDMVVKAIEVLDEKFRLTLYYRYFKDMSVSQIADLMGISEKTVYTRLTRGKARLLELLRMEGII